MRIPLIIGLFFLFLAIIFGIVAAKDYAANNRVAAIARRRIAVIFAMVGIGLIAWQLTANR